MPDTANPALLTRLPGLWPGGLAALASAALFGGATPLAKALLAQADPWMLAAVLYLGAGLGLALLRFALSRTRHAHREALLSSADWPWLGGATLAGGVAAPVMLMFGLALTPASAASLMLTLEGVLTILLAGLIFREALHWRVGVGAAAILAGVVVLSWPETLSFSGVLGPILISGSCLAWAIDNNLTRKIALSDPLQIATIKGLAAGGINLAIALGAGSSLPLALPAFGIAAVGFIGYGLSLVLFILALRHIGTARAGAYFSTAPFAGAVLAVAGFGDVITPSLIAAGVLMAAGVWLQLREQHDHEHEHEALAHSHRHYHDAHHQHEHGPGDPEGEPHTHWHVHGPLRHSHPHYPDAHHRHKH